MYIDITLMLARNVDFPGPTKADLNSNISTIVNTHQMISENERMQYKCHD